VLPSSSRATRFITSVKFLGIPYNLLFFFGPS
jgi:hypothetical protein